MAPMEYTPDSQPQWKNHGFMKDCLSKFNGKI